MKTALSLLLIALPAAAERPAFSGEIEIRQALDRLNTVGSVMMIGAHPDDEREAVLAYLARGRHVRTAYLSLTRGEGGQNLIGPEQGDQLGVIRTQELLASRRIDAAEQFFTRAIDFGFSKTAEETLTKWPREKILGDVVYNIRRFRPDVILLVFSGTPRDGHGHHQASAILGREAFTLAADPTKFPEQLAYVEPWQAKRLMRSAGFGPGPNAQGGAPAEQNAVTPQQRAANRTPDPADNPAERLDLDVGVYSPDLGYSFSEIGGWSRSANRSQGTGSAERKGSQKNPMLTLIGDKTTKDLFEGIDLTWNRIPGGAEAGAVLKQALDSYVAGHPEAMLPILARARPMIAAIPLAQDKVVKDKLRELDETMALCAGVWLEAQADQFAASPGAALKVNLSAVARLPVPVALTSIRLTGMEGAPAVNIAPTVLVANQPSQYNASVTIPANQPYSGPYWLNLPKEGSTYAVNDPREVGIADNHPVLEGVFGLRVAGIDLELTRPVQHRYVDRVQGERVRPLTIVPPVALDLSEKALVFPNTGSRRIEVPVRSNTGKVAGDVRLEAPQGWKVEPASRHFEFSAADEQTTLSFELTPPEGEARGTLRALAQVGDRAVSSGTEVIEYPHIQTQTLFPPAEASLVRSEIKTLAKHIGYVVGAGDEVAAALKQLGCEVTLLSSEDLARGDLSKFDAIVAGVRAFNVRADLRANHQRLWDYAQNGGTVVVQYNYANGPQDRAFLDAAHVGPYPFRNSADRVTEEDAPVRFPNPQLAVLQAPNKITPADFEGWVQERGVYFADQWDARYTPVLESNDMGETPLGGGMLYAKLGKGAYVFSAYSWFRQLPAGVPGAYRIFANMLSAAKVQ